VFLRWDQGCTWGDAQLIGLAQAITGFQRIYILMHGGTADAMWLSVDDPGYIEAFGTFLRRHRRARFVSFFNRPVGSAYDLGRKPRKPAAYLGFITPLSR
jgi:hypothetical protein